MTRKDVKIVSNRKEVDVPQAVQHAHAVISVLQDAISEGELHDVRAQLPKEYGRLFEADLTAKGEEKAGNAFVGTP